MKNPAYCLFPALAFAMVLSLCWNNIIQAQTAKLDLIVAPDAPPATIEELEAADCSGQFVTGFFDMGEDSNLFDPPEQEIDLIKQLIKKEPECELPFPVKGVVHIAGQDFAFMLDTPPSDDDEKKFMPGGSEEGMEYVYFNRLFFDMNRNGDLTDDGVIHGTSFKFDGYVLQTWFPRITIPIDVDGQQYEHSMTINAYGFRWYRTVNSDGEPIEDPKMIYRCSINCKNAGFRTGKIVLDGQERQVVLFDANADGRFDNLKTSEDTILFDPELISEELGLTKIGDLRHPFGTYAAQTILLDRKYYDLSITPSGDQVTMTLSEDPVGYLTPTHDEFSAMISTYDPDPDSDNFTCQIYELEGDRGDKIPILAGEWIIVYYEIRKPGAQDFVEADPNEGFHGSLISLMPPAPLKPILIIEGETHLFECESPLIPKIDVYTPERLNVATEEVPWPVGIVVRGDKTEFYLQINDSKGYILRDLIIDGSLPESPPSFTIRSPEGVEILSDSFEYG
jgi:hypothetical protein